MKATKQQLRDEIRRIRSIGQRLSNVAYNYGQNSHTSTLLSTQDKDMLFALAKEWDTVPRSE